MLTSGYTWVCGRLNVLANWRFFKRAVFLACVAPGCLLAWRAWQGDLGVDPLKTLLHETGEDALSMLFASLAVTPVRRVFRVNGVQRVRRLVGVFAFVYAVAHVCMYLGLDQLCFSFETCDMQSVVEDVLKRKFIFMGLVSFSILALLAVTSTNAMIRRLKRNWQRLHRLVYAAAVSAVVHYAWIQKSDISEPLVWAGGLVALLLVRLSYAAQGQRRNDARRLV